MTAIARFPNTEADYVRLTAHQRRANEAAELEANLITARADLNNAAMHRTEDVRNAIILLESRGDMRGDLILAHEATGLLTIRERREAHAASKDAQRKYGPALGLLTVGYLALMAIIVVLAALGVVTP